MRISMLSRNLLKLIGLSSLSLMVSASSFAMGGRMFSQNQNYNNSGYPASSYETPRLATDAQYSSWLDSITTHPSDPSIVQLAHEITAGQASEMGKVIAIHDWVVANISFDWAQLNDLSRWTQLADALTVLNRRTGICSGYASLTASLLRASGIPAKMVTGKLMGAAANAPGGGGDWAHEWNKAYVNGSWIVIDATVDTGWGGARSFLNPNPSLYASTHQEYNESSGE